MKRMLILSVLIAFLFGAMAYATETRVVTMGEVNNIVKDEANMSLYPSTVNYYPKEFLGEFSGYDYWKAGANFLVAEESEKPFVLGAYFSQDSYVPDILWTLYDLGFVSYGDVYDAYVSNYINLYYGRNLGEIPFGFNFGLYHGSSKYEDSVVTKEEEMSLTRFEFGLGISPMEKKLDAGAHLAFTTWKDKQYVGLAQDAIRDMTKPKGNIMFDLNLRYWMDPMGKYTIVPHAMFSYDKQGIDSYGQNADDQWVVEENFKTTETEFDFGFGMNYDASENVLVVGDLGFNLNNYKVTYEEMDPDTTVEWKEKTLVLPYFRIGIDAKVFKWMDFRSGVYTRWEKNTDEPSSLDFYPDYVKETWADATTDTYVGAGFHWSTFYIDSWINPDFIQNGPAFISGDYGYDKGTLPFAYQVTLKYMF